MKLNVVRDISKYYLKNYSIENKNSKFIRYNMENGKINWTIFKIRFGRHKILRNKNV